MAAPTNTGIAYEQCNLCCDPVFPHDAIPQGMTCNQHSFVHSECYSKLGKLPYDSPLFDALAKLSEKYKTNCTACCIATGGANLHEPSIQIVREAFGRYGPSTQSQTSQPVQKNSAYSVNASSSAQITSASSQTLPIAYFKEHLWKKEDSFTGNVLIETDKGTMRLENPTTITNFHPFRHFTTLLVQVGQMDLDSLSFDKYPALPSFYKKPLQEVIACCLPGSQITRLKSKEEFWNMVWNKNQTFVFDLVGREELKHGCAYMTEVGTEEQWGNLKVTLAHSAFRDPYNCQTYELERNGVKKTMTHIHYPKWPDNGVPDFPEFTRLVQQFHKYTENKDEQQMIVHCRLGLGRTGTLITCSFLYDLKDWIATLPTENHVLAFTTFLINHLRSQRGCQFVYSDAQINFVYEYALSLWKSLKAPSYPALPSGGSSAQFGPL